MKTRIFYFTGTGNSLFVAKHLEKTLPNTIITPMISVLKKDVVYVYEDIIGFVFPIYMLNIPLPVQQFIEKLEFRGVTYTFAIGTRTGITHGAFETINKILNTKNFDLDAYFNLTMGNNTVKFKYEAPSKEHLQELEHKILNKLGPIIEIISNQQSSKEKDVDATTKLPRILSKLTKKLAQNSDTKMHADEKCIGCGTCEQVCPSQKVKLTDGKPIWNKDILCYKCTACINFCPQQAAQITNMTEKNPRYSHPYATVDDMIAQKTGLL